MRLRHEHGRSAGAPRQRERGETLIEVLLTVALMGSGIIVILGGLLSATTLARQNADRTKAGSSLDAFAESVVASLKDSNGPEVAGGTAVRYQDCAAPDGPIQPDGTWSDGTYSDLTKLPDDPTGTDPARSVNKGLKAHIKSIDFLSLTKFDSFGAPQWLSSGSSCANFPDGGMQRITLEIVRSGVVVDTVVVIKRDATCPSTFDNADLGPC